MDQASASSAASCAHSPVAPRTSSSCSRSADRSQTGVPLPARSGPQSEPHAAPSNKHPSPSPPPSTDSRLRAISCRSFTAAQPHNPAASLRDYCSGAYSAIVEFSSVVAAVTCAAAIQARLATSQDGIAPERRIILRIGVHLGDVIVEGEDLLGDGVNIAARLEQLYPPGGVLISAA